MIRKLIWTMVLIGIAALIAFGMRNYPGSVSFEWFSWQISMSIYVFALLSLLTFVVFLVVATVPWHGRSAQSLQRLARRQT